MPPRRGENGESPDDHRGPTAEDGPAKDDERRRRFLTHLSMGDESCRSLHDDDDAAAPTQNGKPPSSSMVDFLRHFAGTDGPPQIILLCLLLAVALGSTIGVVPAVMTDRYARLGHGYGGGTPCMDLARDERPEACRLGNDDAQNASAAVSFVSNVLTFVTSGLVGSISDERGRRSIMLAGMALSLLGPAWLVVMQLDERFSPLPFYAAHAFSGVISWVAVSLSAMSDVIRPEWRAPSFGLVIAGFSAGFALSPFLAVYLSHLGVSVASLFILTGSFGYAVLRLPETLDGESAEQARKRRIAETPVFESAGDRWRHVLLRPARELMILNRSRLFRLLSSLAFFSGIVGSADMTLFVYYAEEQYDFDDRDIARMFAIKGAAGMVIQTLLLKELVSRMGERRVIILAFSVGAVHNWMYGVAESKALIFFAATMAALTSMSFPTISAIKSNNVDEAEQGRVQGALYSLSSLAGAVGPMSLRYVYAATKDGRGGLLHSPGTMFVFGAFLYAVATYCAWLLPEDQANSNYVRRHAKKRGSLAEFDAGYDYGAVGEDVH